jgi:uncharacterized protein
MRCVRLGEQSQVYAVVFTVRGTDVIRIISARRANARERKAYEARREAQGE